VIQVSGVYKRYANGFEALKNVSFNIAQGEMVFLTGHSGAGKSTLLKLIAGIERPSSGYVEISKQNLSRLRAAGLAVLRRNIGLVFQDHKLLFDRTVFDNVVLPLYINGYKPSDMVRRVRAALDKVGLLEREKAYPIALSGGEQQRLCIARAIVNRPTMLIADEPTGNLDADHGAAIFELFHSFNQVGTTVLVSTHDHTHIERLQPRILHLDQGRLIS
jgi:cell division transport system ATP-binding protein